MDAEIKKVIISAMNAIIDSKKEMDKKNNCMDLGVARGIVTANTSTAKLVLQLLEKRS